MCLRSEHEEYTVLKGNESNELPDTLTSNAASICTSVGLRNALQRTCRRDCGAALQESKALRAAVQVWVLGKYVRKLSTAY